MRQMIRKVVYIVAPFLLCLGMSLPVYAMTDEEKELFDALGVEYTLDENGNFKEFHPDYNMERMSHEQKRALAEKYKGVSKVGNYNVMIGMGKDVSEFILRIADENYYDIYYEDACVPNSVILFDMDGDFYNIGYKDHNSTDSFLYAEGNIELSEMGINTWDEYEKNENGEFVIAHSSDGYNFYSYDEEGELKSRKNYSDKITYDPEDNPIAKEIDTTDMAGLYRSVPYSVADEVQRLVNENDGSFYIYVEEADCETILPEIRYLIMEGQQALKLGLTLEEYRELHNIYEEI